MEHQFIAFLIRHNILKDFIAQKCELCLRRGRGVFLSLHSHIYSVNPNDYLENFNHTNKDLYEFFWRQELGDKYESMAIDE